MIKATHLVQCNIVVQNIIDVKATSSKYLIFMSGRDGRYSSSAGRRGQEELSLIKYFSITINKKTIERLLQPRAWWLICSLGSISWLSWPPHSWAPPGPPLSSSAGPGRAAGTPGRPWSERITESQLSTNITSPRTHTPGPACPARWWASRPPAWGTPRRGTRTPATPPPPGWGSRTWRSRTRAWSSSCSAHSPSLPDSCQDLVAALRGHNSALMRKCRLQWDWRSICRPE